MARIRSIKPEIWQSEGFNRLGLHARLLFIGLITQSDDDGRIRASSRGLASLLLPFDEYSHRAMEVSLGQLAEEGMFLRYVHEGATYGVIPKFRLHQKIDHPTPSKLPAPPDALANPRESSRILAPDLGSRIEDLGPRINTILSDESDEGSGDDGFDGFWTEYGKKEGKKGAVSAWKRLSKANRQAAIDGIPALIAARPEAQYRPHPQKYLNQGLWENEYAVDTPASSGPPDHWIASETLSAEGMAEALRLTILRRSAPDSPYLPGQEP